MPEQAELNNPRAVVAAPYTPAIPDFGYAPPRVWVADSGNFRIRAADCWVTPGDVINTVAGTGDPTPVAFNSSLTGPQTPIQSISALAADGQGNIYFPVVWTDLGTTIMRMSIDGTTTRVAGGGKSTTAGVDALDFALPDDIPGLAVNRYDGSLLICGSDGKVYSVAGVAEPA